MNRPSGFSYRSFDKDLRKAQTATLKDAIHGMLQHFRIDAKFKETQVINSWEKIMGTPIFNHTSNIFLRDRVLYIELDSAPLKQQLVMARSKVLELINREAGSEIIDDVVFL
jgi:predicted nucleic acid-binding Zn ribbon protein